MKGYKQSSVYKRWINKRIPKQSTHHFRLNNLFILPSRFALALILISLAVYMLGTNYANNIILLLAYLIVSLLIVAMHTSFFNMLGLQVKVTSQQAVFLGQAIQLNCYFSSAKTRYNLNIAQQRLSGNNEQLARIDKLDAGNSKFTLFIKPESRGWFISNRFVVQSYAPLFWFRVWSLPDFNIKQLVYPKPVACPQWITGTGRQSDGEQLSHLKNEIDDFQGFKTYSPTDSLKHVAWKQVAKGKGMLTKIYTANQQSIVWFSYYRLGAAEHELALSQLTWLVLQAKQTQIQFGLELPKQTIQPAQGEQHVEKCLIALAEHP